MFVALHTSTLARSLPSTTSNGSWVGALALAPTPHTLVARRRCCCRCCMPATCYTHTTCSALLPCTDCTLAQPLPLATANSAAYLTHSTICTTAPPQRSLATDAAAAAACLLHAHYLLCAATVHRLHSRPAPALPTANSPTCLTLYYYLYDCGSTISLLAADAATAAARALPNLRYHRLCMLPRQAPALPSQHNG